MEKVEVSSESSICIGGNGGLPHRTMDWYWPHLLAWHGISNSIFQQWRPCFLAPLHSVSSSVTSSSPPCPRGKMFFPFCGDTYLCLILCPPCSGTLSRPDGADVRMRCCREACTFLPVHRSVLPLDAGPLTGALCGTSHRTWERREAKHVV